MEGSPRKIVKSRGHLEGEPLQLEAQQVLHEERIHIGRNGHKDHYRGGNKVILPLVFAQRGIDTKQQSSGTLNSMA